ncbi:hypothetical protein ACSU1N_05375 [Thermogladius sp. 4427co]|uniref:hypothetical protein n=1 Tax=Thermogladius sp. 4427co TaxID=3450718 RepID=UPI003F78C67D
MDKWGIVKIQVIVTYIVISVLLIALQIILIPNISYGVFPGTSEITIAPVGRTGITIAFYNDATSREFVSSLVGFNPVIDIKPGDGGEIVFVRGYGIDWILTLLTITGLGVLVLGIIRLDLEQFSARIMLIVLLLLVFSSLAIYAYNVLVIEKTPVVNGWYVRVSDRPVDKVNITGIGYEMGVLDYFNGSYLVNIRTNASIIAFYSPSLGLEYWQGCIGTEGVQYLSKYVNFTDNVYVLIQPWNSSVYYSRITFTRFRSGLEGLFYLTLSILVQTIAVVAGVYSQRLTRSRR